MRVLVCYASRFGSTRDIANRIGDAVRKDGSDVDVRSVDDIPDFDRYDAVVFGSGVYDGSWQQKRLNSCADTLPYWRANPCGYSVLDRSANRHPIVGTLIKKEPKEISEFERTLHSRDYRVFAGVIDLDHWPAWGRLLFRAFGGHAGDNRQWADIDAWAEEIARELRALDWESAPTSRGGGQLNN